MRSFTKEFMSILKDFPVSVDRIVDKKHIKLYLNTPTGKQIMVLPNSASDHKAMKNQRALLARWCRVNEGNGNA